jgi:hypothetical protein
MWRVLIALIVFSGLHVSAAGANEVDYVYHGNPLVLSPNSICNSEDCLSITGNPVSATAVLIDGVFDPNQACVRISGSINLGGCGLFPPTAATVDLTLDKFGNVIDWDSRFHVGGSLFDFEILSSPSGDSVLYNFCIPDCPSGIAGDLARWTATAGFWTPIFPTPVLASFPLFATGVGLLGLLGWRRRRKASAASCRRG